MKKRMTWMLAALLLFVAAMGLVKFMQIRAAIAAGGSWAPPPEAVTTIVAAPAEWPATMSAVGSIAAVHGVTVSADLPGVVERIAFESGKSVRAGEVLVQLDTRQERAQLGAAEAQRDLAKLNLDRGRQLLEQKVIAQAEYDQLAATWKSAQARVGEIRATIGRKTIRAPFSGVLGIRRVNLGQYLNGGDAVVPLQSMDPLYVDFSVPQQQAGALRTGSAVRITVDSVAVTDAPGAVTAIDAIVDPDTRNVHVQGTLHNRGAHLRPGMFVDVQVALGASQRVIAIPTSAVNYAPYGNSVFVVTQMKDPKGQAYRGVRQAFVRVGEARGDQVAVLSGLKAGEEVVTSGVFKLRNGAAVQVNNAAIPANNPAPKPEDS